MKFYQLLIILFIFVFSAFGQTKKHLPNPKPATNEIAARADEKAEGKKDFSIEAIVIYPSGEIFPVSGSTFYILDTDLLTILKNAEIEPTKNTLKIFKGNTDKALISDAGYSLSGKFPSPYSELAAKVGAAIKAHIVQRITTDYQGRATFKNLGEGNYFLFGTGGTRFSNVIWNISLDTNTNSSITLDQNNAASAY